MPPKWFTDALAADVREHELEVDDCPIRYLEWGKRGRPGLVLVHGGAAHAHWWSFLAPLLADQYHVVAPHLSGHGDSGRRSAYPRETWAKEVLTVAQAAEFPAPPVLIGHSLGGFVSIVAASIYGDQLAGAIIVDSPVRKPDPESEEGSRGRMFRRPKTYASFEEAMDHFVLVPPQPCDNDFILRHVATHSLRRSDDGWTWKFDAKVFEKVSPTPMSEFLGSTRCRIGLFPIIPAATRKALFYFSILDGRVPIIH